MELLQSEQKEAEERQLQQRSELRGVRERKVYKDLLYIYNYFNIHNLFFDAFLFVGPKAASYLPKGKADTGLLARILSGHRPSSFIESTNFLDNLIILIAIPANSNKK